MNKKRKSCVLDLDDTVSDFIGNLLRVHNAFNGTHYGRDVFTSWNMPEDLQRTFKKYESALYISQPILPKVKEKLKSLKKKGYYIILMTARDSSFREATIFNLSINGVPFDELLFNKNKSLKINQLMKKYDVRIFADDKMSTCNKVAEYTKVPNVYVITRSHNRNIERHERVKRIFNLSDVEDKSTTHD